ncbi:MAG: nucleoside permease [Salinivirgaceae bacterium]|nr:nucleoside permease [Salinivirgaceae bacterium]MDD4746134.1 nucleoside permease [Salinivirgaceae bacterium]MDY0279909.1 nucleoside permease [Salinivirgaceae bacterium]
MNLKLRLTVMNFLQFYVWGSWLITIGNYWFGTQGWGPTEFGAVFLTLGIASMFMPALTGIIADRWMNAEKLYAILHLLGGAAICSLPWIDTPNMFFWVMLIAMSFYMPTIALTNTIGYNALKKSGLDVVRDFPPIRVWGTVGFIAAMWVTNLTGNKSSEMMFYFSAIASLILGIYSFTLPKCPPQMKTDEKSSFIRLLGLDAFKLFANYKMALFFIFSMLLGASLQLTNMYGDVFLDEFKFFPEYANSFVIKYSTIVMSISQISETLFILTIPFFLKRFGIKNVMLFSMLAWFLRFALFGFGDPTGNLWMIILSMIVYGMAFDFFNISGALFVETQCDSSMRGSAQGLFMMMTNGFGTIIGALGSGILIDKFFTFRFTNIENLATHFNATKDSETILSFMREKGISILDSGLLDSVAEVKDWPTIWIAFAAYSLAVAILFAFLFKHKHNPDEVQDVMH